MEEVRYPIVNNWVSFERLGPDDYRVYDESSDCTYRMKKEDLDFLMKLDGKTDPYSIPTSHTKIGIRNLLGYFDHYDLTSSSRIQRKGIGTIRIRLIRFRASTPLVRFFSIFDRFLSVLWLPVFLLGVYRLVSYTGEISLSHILSGTVFGLLLSIPLHETGHAAACVRYNGKVWEFGAGIERFAPYAFVDLSTKSIKSRQRRAHINAAGIEVNLLLTGLFLLLAFAFPDIGGFFFFAAIQAGFHGMINMLFAPGADGMSILAEFLSCERLPEYARSSVFDKQKRKRLCRSGVNGLVTIAVCCFILLFQLLLPVLIVSYLLFLIGVRSML